VRLDSEIGGSPKRGLVPAPLLEGLLCAAFLTSDIPELLKAPLEQPQQQELKAGCIHAADIPFENAEYWQGAPTISRRMPSLLCRWFNRRSRNNSHRSSRRFAYEDCSHSRRLAYKDRCQQPQVQQGERRASLDAQHVVIGELVSGNGELATTAENNADVGFHLTDSS